MAFCHILQKHIHMVVSVWSGLLVHWEASEKESKLSPSTFAKGVENLMKDCILGQAAGDLQVDCLLTTPPVDAGVDGTI